MTLYFALNALELSLEHRKKMQCKPKSRRTKQKTDLTRLPHLAFLEPLSYRPQWILQWHECSLQRVAGDLETHPLLPEQTHRFQTSVTRSKFIRQDIGLTIAFYSGEVIHISSLALLKV